MSRSSQSTPNKFNTELVDAIVEEESLPVWAQGELSNEVVQRCCQWTLLFDAIFCIGRDWAGDLLEFVRIFDAAILAIMQDVIAKSIRVYSLKYRRTA